MGVDLACFGAASLLPAHGGNAYDVNQLWQQENLPYSVPITRYIVRGFELRRTGQYGLAETASERLVYLSPFVLLQAARVAH
jgi:hypothetical protein